MKTIATLLFACGTALSLPAAAQQATGISAHWPLNGDANDATGNGHNGTLHNVVPATGRSGIPNSAYYFNGVNSSITVPNSSAWNVTQYTIGAVIKPTAFNAALCQGNYVIARGGQTDGRWALSYHDNWYNDCNTTDTSKFLFFNYPGMAYFPPGSPAAYTPTIETNTWYTVVATYDGSHAKVYVNGALKSDVYYVANMQPNTDSVIIGRERVDPSSPYPFPFIGVIDDIQFYNRALTDSEIVHYTIPVPSMPDTPGTGNTGGDTTSSSHTTTGLSPVSDADAPRLSPNPAEDYIDVMPGAAFSSTAQLSLLSALGQTILQQPCTGTSVRLPLQDLPSGIYMLQIRSDAHIWTGRVIRK